MKYSKKYLFAAAAILVMAACDKTKEPGYVPAASVSSGEQVFFPGSLEDKIIMALEDVSFSIPVNRGTSNLEAMDVELSATGDALTYFNVPGVVSFAEGESATDLVITVKDPDAMTVGKFYPLSLAVASEELTTPYGRCQIDITAGYDFPWIKFDKGVLVNMWMDGEEYPDLEMQYQQISDHMRYCKVEGRRIRNHHRLLLVLGYGYRPLLCASPGLPRLWRRCKRVRPLRYGFLLCEI